LALRWRFEKSKSDGDLPGTRERGEAAIYFWKYWREKEAGSSLTIATAGEGAGAALHHRPDWISAQQWRQSAFGSIGKTTGH
jgi:hypothetical protein